jgi:hypothetical protein
MSDLDVKITGINIIHKPKPWLNGDKPLAFFDIATRGFNIVQCMLIQRKSGGLITTMPKGELESGRRMIHCGDSQLLDVITSSAKRAFESLGGKI